MRVLVTGGSGFVGSHVVERLLDAGHAVRVLVRRASDTAALRARGVELAVGELQDPASLRRAADGAEWVIHCAAKLAGHSEHELLAVNVDGTRNLAQACAAAKSVRRFVHVSSLAAGGPSTALAPLDEDRPARPLTWYGRSKLASEHVLADFAALRPVIVRPPIVYGPRERELLRLFRSARRGVLPVVGSGRKLYSLVFVADLVDALLRAAASEAVASRVYYAGAPEPVSWEGFCRAVAAAVGRRAVLLRLPEALGVGLARANGALARLRGRTTLLDGQKALEMRQPAWTCDSSRARRELGWTAGTPLADGLAATAGWYREQGWI
ncbi:MAG: NAD(P)-dependent oxidoreductase [Acidobacteria bacterium]|nr:NAD(P)-dependent oxidoreductase [Acidobacteriota bacterium]